MEDNKTQGGGAKRRPLGGLRRRLLLSVGMGFLCVAPFPGTILGRFSEFVPNLVRVAIQTHPGFQIVFFFSPTEAR